MSEPSPVPSFPTSLGISEATSIRLLGQDLAADLMGRVGFGELAFWLVAAFFGTWYVVMTWQLLTTISHQPIDPGDDADGNRPRLQHAPT